ncbi:MAG: hypothetical protein HUJ31_02760 [Pseudomonadales bacterium]|nr:hypothetical protein [Pseudomonadales bacterium]
MNRPVIIAALLAFTVCNPAAADEGPDLAFHGYGTVGLVKAGTDDADFVRSFLQADGSGKSADWTFDVDSRLGLQMDARLSDKLSGVVQVLAQHDHDGTFRPGVEWANLKYEFSPALSIRLGRTATSPFIASEFRLVGISYPWVRPPLELYDILPMTSIDGIDIAYQQTFGQSLFAFEFSWGQRDVASFDHVSLEAREIMILNTLIALGKTQFHLGYATGEVTFENLRLTQLLDGLAQFATTTGAIPGLKATSDQAQAIHDYYRFDGDRHSLLTIGVQHQSGRFLAMVEAGWYRPTALPNLLVYSTTAGYLFGRFTPYAAFSKVDFSSTNTHTLTTRELPPTLMSAASTLNDSILNLVTDYAAAQHTASLGLRFDMAPNASLKFQFDHIVVAEGSRGRFINADSDFRRGKSVDVLSIVVDFVF